MQDQRRKIAWIGKPKHNIEALVVESEQATHSQRKCNTFPEKMQHIPRENATHSNKFKKQH